MEKSSLMMIVIIVLLVALLGTVVGVTFYAFNMVSSMETATQTAGGFDRSQRTLHPDEIGRIVIGDVIITNLATNAGGFAGHARVQVVVGYDQTQERDSANVSELIHEQMDYIRMIALASINNRTREELAARDGMETLAAELLETLQNDFRTNMIVSVGFSEWIID